MFIHKIISDYHNSNTYIIETDNKDVIIIDPGNPDISEIRNWLKVNNKKIIAVILTHEHADHCAGVNHLYELEPFQLFCSQKCAENIKNSKQNFSFYIDIIDSFEIYVHARVVSDSETITINGEHFNIVETPGHSPGSVCILFYDAVFTGDTLLNKIKTPLTFPHSNRRQYEESVGKLNKLLNPDMNIYPGHGEPFQFC